MVRGVSRPQGCPAHKLPVEASSFAYRSLIAGDLGRLERQRLLAERATELQLDRGTEKPDGVVPLALGLSLAARGRSREARPLIRQGVAILRRPGGQPTEAAMALLAYASAMRGPDDRHESPGVIAEARSVLEYCPDPGVLTGKLRILERIRRARDESGSHDLTTQEFRVLKLLHSDLSERAMGPRCMSPTTPFTATSRLSIASSTSARELTRSSGPVS